MKNQTDDKTCATCRYYDDLNHECYADNPGADGCWESEDEENVECGMVTNWRLFDVE